MIDRDYSVMLSRYLRFTFIFNRSKNVKVIYSSDINEIIALLQAMYIKSIPMVRRLSHLHIRDNVTSGNDDSNSK